MKDLDQRGIPGCFVATVEFKDAAASQTRSIGFEPAIVWTPHPIQNRTPQELEQLADEMLEPILAAIGGGAGGEERASGGG